MLDVVNHFMSNYVVSKCVCVCASDSLLNVFYNGVSFWSNDASWWKIWFK